MEFITVYWYGGGKTMPTYRQYKEMIEKNKENPYMLKGLEADIRVSRMLSEEEKRELLDLIDRYVRAIYPGSSRSSRQHSSSSQHSSHSECDSCGIECLRKHEMEALTNPGKRDIFGKLIRERLYQKGIVEAVDWAENVADWIECCREAGGVPMFVTKYAGQRFKDPKHPGRYLVLGKCYAPEKPCPSMWFDNVPEEDVERLEAD